MTLEEIEQRLADMREHPEVVQQPIRFEVRVCPSVSRGTLRPQEATQDCGVRVLLAHPDDIGEELVLLPLQLAE